VAALTVAVGTPRTTAPEAGLPAIPPAPSGVFAASEAGDTIVGPSLDPEKVSVISIKKDFLIN